MKNVADILGKYRWTWSSKHGAKRRLEKPDVLCTYVKLRSRPTYTYWLNLRYKWTKINTFNTTFKSAYITAINIGRQSVLSFRLSN